MHTLREKKQCIMSTNHNNESYSKTDIQKFVFMLRKKNKTLRKRHFLKNQNVIYYFFGTRFSVHFENICGQN